MVFKTPYTPKKEIQKIIDHFWPQSGHSYYVSKEFTISMKNAQFQMIQHYYEFMDEYTKQRAMMVLNGTYRGKKQRNYRI